MTLSFTAVIFDWGGVFQQTTDYRSRTKWDDQLGLEHGTIEQMMFDSETWKQAQLGTLSTDDHWTAFGEEIGLPSAEVTRLRADFFAGDSIAVDVVSTLKSLKAANYPVALMSNNIPELRADIGKLGLTSFFDEIVISADIGVMKPEPSAYLAAVEGLGAPAEQTIFIDDSFINIIGAQRVGLQTIHYNSRLKLADILLA